jgi:hypothetical protein
VNPEITEKKYRLWEELVRKTVAFVIRDFPDVASEDLFQDLMIYILQNTRLTDPELEYAASGLYKKAIKIAWEYRKQSLYITSQYSYRTSDVKRILETLFTRRDWSRAFVPDDAKSLSADDRLVVSSDVAAAYDSLSDSYKEVIFRRYALKESLSATDRSKLARATEKIADFLNFYRPPKRAHNGPGARRVMGNAQAGWIIQEQDGLGED